MNFHEMLVDLLKDPKDSQNLLNEILSECSTGNLSEQVFLTGLKDVIQAQGGVLKIAAKAQMTPSELERTLNSQQLPPLPTIAKIFKALGFQLKV